MNETTENFLKALQQYKTPEAKPVVWKLYYNIKTGIPVDLTTDDLEISDNDIVYIVVSREIADTYPHLNPRTRIVDGKITRIQKTVSPEHVPYKIRVVPEPQGNIVTDDYNMLIINKAGKNRWAHE